MVREPVIRVGEVDNVELLHELRRLRRSARDLDEKRRQANLKQHVAAPGLHSGAQFTRTFLGFKDSCGELSRLTLAGGERREPPGPGRLSGITSNTE